MRTFRDRFPPPWHVDEIPGGFAVVSANGVRLAYVYVRAAESERGLTRGEALALAGVVVGLSQKA